MAPGSPFCWCGGLFACARGYAILANLISGTPALADRGPNALRSIGNATGVTLLQDELADPDSTRTPPEDNELREAQRAAQALGIKLHPIEVRRTGDFDGAFRRASDLHADALYVVSSRHTVLNLPLIVEFATKDRVPLAGGWGDWAKAGGLLSYGPNVGVMARGATMLLDKTLKGAKPADLPVLQPTKFELVINLKTAKALGLEVPWFLQQRADEVIE
jgi:putative tryptophan/tyrosine transport system substrate-binding protein